MFVAILATRDGRVGANAMSPLKSSAHIAESEMHAPPSLALIWGNLGPNERETLQARNCIAERSGGCRDYIPPKKIVI